MGSNFVQKFGPCKNGVLVLAVDFLTQCLGKFVNREITVLSKRLESLKSSKILEKVFSQARGLQVKWKMIGQKIAKNDVFEMEGIADIFTVKSWIKKFEK